MVFSTRRDLALEVDPRTQYLSDAPGLREAATLTVRRVTIKYLANASQAGAVQLLRHGLEKRLRQPRITVHAVVGAHKGAEQPAPGRAHVVSGIALPAIAPVAAYVPWILRAQAAQPVAGQQFAPAAIDHGAHLFLTQGGIGQRHREDLVRTDARVEGASPIDIDHVVQARAPRVPKAREARAGAREQRLAEAFLAHIASSRGEADGDIQSVQPQRIDFHRLANPRREHLAAVLGVHPGQLRSPFAPPPQALPGIPVNSLPNSLPRPLASR